MQLVAAPLAVALGALRLSGDLERSRSRIVVAREEERRRLRRDLHDGLGPTLTGLALAADAATNFLDRDPEQSRQLLGSLRRDTRTAIGEVRRLIDDLRPPALDELGLLGALNERVDALRRRDDGSIVDVRLVAPDGAPGAARGRRGRRLPSRDRGPAQRDAARRSARGGHRDQLQRLARRVRPRRRAGRHGLDTRRGAERDA